MPISTQHLTVDSTSPDEKLLMRAVAVLRTGGLVAMPTETVYGLAANALDDSAVRKIYAAKGRPSNNPLIVHVSSVEQAQALASDWPEWAARLAARFWPGPLTLVLSRSAQVSDVVTGGGWTVAIRMPQHVVARRLIELAGLPLAAPSANTSTRISPTTAEHVLKTLDGRIEMVLDAGPTTGGIESTVVGNLDGRVRLLRPGPLSVAAIESALGASIATGAIESSGDGDAALISPGTLARHYAPVVALECVACSEGSARVGELLKDGGHVGWLRFGSQPRLNQQRLVEIQMPATAAEYATQLYAALHELEAAGVERMVVELPPDEPAWLAIQDRLRRASHST